MNGRLQRVPVFASSLVQLTSEGGRELFLCRWLFQLADVSHFATFCPWGLRMG